MASELTEIEKMMQVNTQELMHVVARLAQVENLKITVKESNKNGLIIGSSALLGGLCAGPAGLLIGGVSSSIFSYIKSRGKFKSVTQIIMEDLSSEDRVELATLIYDIIRNISFKNSVELLQIIMETPFLKDLVIKTLISFVQNKLNVCISQ